MIPAITQRTMRLSLATALIVAGVTTLQSLNFRTTFDVYATPKMFLLDRDKRVIAKQVGAEQISEILAREEQMMGQ